METESANEGANSGAHLESLGRALKESLENSVTKRKAGRGSRVERHETEPLVSALRLNSSWRLVGEDSDAEKRSADATGDHHSEDLTEHRKDTQTVRTSHCRSSTPPVTAAPRGSRRWRIEEKAIVLRMPFPE